MNIYIISGSIVILIVLLVFALILHSTRVSSTKATDYFNNLDSKSTEEENSESSDENKSEEEIIEVNKDTGQDVKSEQTAKYLMLLEMHKNNKYKNEIQKIIDAIDEDYFNELNDYITIAELSILLALGTDETISFLISLGLIDRDHYTLVLTDKGVYFGGQYNNQEDVTWVEFPKDLINRLGTTYKKEPEIEVKEKNKEAGDNLWFLIIVVALVYFFFFK